MTLALPLNSSTWQVWCFLPSFFLFIFISWLFSWFCSASHTCILFYAIPAFLGLFLQLAFKHVVSSPAPIFTHHSFLALLFGCFFAHADTPLPFQLVCLHFSFFSFLLPPHSPHGLRALPSPSHTPAPPHLPHFYYLPPTTTYHYHTPAVTPPAWELPYCPVLHP